MTSTSFNVGLNDNTRVSSRVLRPPGGGHTDIFSGEPEMPPTRRNHNASSIGFGPIAGQDEAKPTNGNVTPSQNGSQTPQEQPTIEPASVPVSAPASASAPAPAPARESKTSPVSEPAKADPPKRVRVPPGGFSSGLW